MESKSHWPTYYENTEGRLPRRGLVEAMEFVVNKERALDLGAGALEDSKYLVGQWFERVVAVDSEPSVQGRSTNEQIHVAISTFENFDFPIESIDLVNAQYSLPFTNPEEFKRVFAAVKNSLRTNGLFVGQLFGNRDGWSNNGSMTFLDKEEVEDLIRDMEVIKFSENERDGMTAAGEAKHWHVFNLIIRKR